MFSMAGSAEVNTMVEIFDDIFQHCCFDGLNFGDNDMFEVLNYSCFINVNFTFQEPPSKKSEGVKLILRYQTYEGFPQWGQFFKNNL